MMFDRRMFGCFSFYMDIIPFCAGLDAQSETLFRALTGIFFTMLPCPERTADYPPPAGVASFARWRRQGRSAAKPTPCDAFIGHGSIHLPPSSSLPLNFGAALL
jgi:hypothetical protein